MLGRAALIGRRCLTLVVAGSEWGKHWEDLVFDSPGDRKAKARGAV